MDHLTVHLGLILFSGQSQLPSSHGTWGSSGQRNVYWALVDLTDLFLNNDKMKS